MISALFLLSCKPEKNKCLKSTGEVVIEERNLQEGFNKIFLSENIDLYLIQDTINKLTFEAGENLMPFLSSELSNNSLSLSNNNSCRFLRSYKVPVKARLHLKELKYLFFSGSGDVISENQLSFPAITFESKDGSGEVDINVQTDSLFIVQHTGPAHFNLKGNSHYQYIYTGGNGWFYGKDLQSDTTHVNNSGTGSVEVNVKNKLIVELKLLGDVIYYGDPNEVVVSTNEGRGKIIKK